jgi:hypothetical protein
MITLAQSRIMNVLLDGPCIREELRPKSGIYGTQFIDLIARLIKKDYVHYNTLYYKKGDIIECNGGSLCLRSKYVEGKFLVFVERPWVESFLKEYCYTLPEWRDIQINSILED